MEIREFVNGTGQTVNREVVDLSREFSVLQGVLARAEAEEAKKASSKDQGTTTNSRLEIIRSLCKSVDPNSDDSTAENVRSAINCTCA